MGELNAIIMSLNFNQIIPVGAGLVALTALGTYKVITKNKKQNFLNNQQIENNNDNDTEFDIKTASDSESTFKHEEIETNKVSKEETLSLGSQENKSNDDLFSELLNESKESRLADETLTNFNNQFSQTEKDSENPLSNHESLNYINHKESSHSNSSNFNSTTENETKEQDKDIRISNKSNTSIVDSTESLLKNIAVESQQIDESRAIENKQLMEVLENESFQNNLNHQPNSQFSDSEEQHANSNLDQTGELSEKFGDLANKLFEEKTFNNKNKEENQYNVWVNYMIKKQGSMILQNTFVQLSSAWGTINSINELQNKINKEVGHYEFNGNPSWAIVSVTPVKD